MSNRTGKKKNNGGYTLVELLVAMIILMIIVGPLLHSFVTAARVNAKAKKTLQATTAAQNIMEQIKATDLATLQGITVPDVDADGNPITRNLVTVNPDGTYTLDYINQQVDSRTFHVVATLDANAYKKTDAANPDEYNDVGISSLYDMNSSTDAFLIEETTLDSDMAKAFGDTDEEGYGSVYQAMERTITIDITDTGSKTVVTGDILYQYNSIERYGIKNQCIFSSASAQGRLRNIYVLFEPMYTTQAGQTALEHVVVNNPSNIPVNVFLVKQENSRTTQTAENKYKVAVNMTEGLRSDYLDDTGSVQVISTLHTNLTGTQLELKYNGLSDLLAGSETISAEQLVDCTTLTPQTVSDRIYKVEVKVYEQGDANSEELVSISGTKTE